MKIKDLIKQLQELDASYDDEYREIFGEPEIIINVFEKITDDLLGGRLFEYAGYSNEIVIEKTDCGTYDIISTFVNNENKNPTIKAKKFPSEPWPFP